ncbi:DNA-directed RNA polymerase subunit omega [Caproicibacterium sp. NSD3]
MIKPIADKLTKKGQSRYSLCVGVAKRAREIIAEAENNPEEISVEKPVEVAVRELQEHKYEIVPGKENNVSAKEEADTKVESENDPEQK